MAWFDWYTLVGMGGLFVVLGIVGFFWGSYEERSYYDNIANRPDVREFLDRLPWRPEPHAIIIGARIAVIVGVFMLLVGGGYWLWK
jgi:hypothetical protein